MKPAAFHIVNKPSNFNAVRDVGRGSQEGNVITYRLFQVTERKEGDMVCIGVQLLSDLLTDICISESKHAAVGVVEDDNRVCAKQLFGDDQGTERISGSSTCIANDVCVSFFKPQHARWIETRIHTCQHSHLTAWGQWK